MEPESTGEIPAEKSRRSFDRLYLVFAAVTVVIWAILLWLLF